MTNIRLQNPYMDETIVVKEDCKRILDMLDSEHIFNNKNDAINELHRLRGVKYRNSRMYTVELVECGG